MNRAAQYAVKKPKHDKICIKFKFDLLCAKCVNDRKMERNCSDTQCSAVIRPRFHLNPKTPALLMQWMIALRAITV